MYGKMPESGLLEIIPLICALTLQCQHPAFLHPESPQGAQSVGGGAASVAEGLMPQHPLFKYGRPPSLSTLGR